MAANPWKREMDHEMERLLRLNTDPDGVIDVEATCNAMTAWLVGNPDILTAEAATIARRSFDAYDKSHRPKASSAQLGLFRPESLIPIGKNERVWMELATREHLILWGAVDDAEFAASAAAQAAKSTYRSQRIQAWAPRYDTLLDLETDVFGYSP